MKLALDTHVDTPIESDRLAPVELYQSQLEFANFRMEARAYSPNNINLFAIEAARARNAPHHRRNHIPGIPQDIPRLIIFLVSSRTPPRPCCALLGESSCVQSAGHHMRNRTVRNAYFRFPQV